MSKHATSFSHPQPTSWSQGMCRVVAIECAAYGRNPEAIPSRLGKGFNPMDEGR